MTHLLESHLGRPRIVRDRSILRLWGRRLTRRVVMYTLSSKKQRTSKIKPLSQANVRRSKSSMSNQRRSTTLRWVERTRGKGPSIRSISSWSSREKPRRASTTTLEINRIIRRRCRGLKTRANWSLRIHFTQLETPWLLPWRPRTKLSYLLIERSLRRSWRQSLSRGQAPWSTKKERWTPTESKTRTHIATTMTAPSFKVRPFSCCRNLNRVQGVLLTKRHTRSMSRLRSTKKFNRRR